MMNNNNVDDILNRKMNKAKKGKQTIDLFNTESNDNKKKDQKSLIHEDEEEDFVINSRVVDARELANAKSRTIDTANAGWAERENVIEFKEEEKPKKGIVGGWGDSVVKTDPLVVVDDYFPDLGDEKAQARPKRDNQNSGLFRGDGMNMSSNSGPTKFTNSKGASGLNKFMSDAPYEEKPRAMYDENLGEDGEETAQVIQFKGKAKFGYDESEAEIKRKAYLAEIENGPRIVAETKISEDEKPKFFSSKAEGSRKNNNLFLGEGEEHRVPAPVAPIKGAEEESEKRVFTSSKRTKNSGLIQTSNAVTVNLAGWD